LFVLFVCCLSICVLSLFFFVCTYWLFVVKLMYLHVFVCLFVGLFVGLFACFINAQVCRVAYCWACLFVCWSVLCCCWHALEPGADILHLCLRVSCVVCCSWHLTFAAGIGTMQCLRVLYWH
jgi:hypothetical protein